MRDRRLWRLLLARTHPDLGGDHELFLFACAAMERLCGPRLGAHGPGPDRAFSAWRGGMSNWASRNREGLRNLRQAHRTRRGR